MRQRILGRYTFCIERKTPWHLAFLGSVLLICLSGCTLGSQWFGLENHLETYPEIADVPFDEPCFPEKNETTLLEREQDVIQFKKNKEALDQSGQDLWASTFKKSRPLSSEDPFR